MIPKFDDQFCHFCVIVLRARLVSGVSSLLRENLVSALFMVLMMLLMLLFMPFLTLM